MIFTLSLRYKGDDAIVTGYIIIILIGAIIFLVGLFILRFTIFEFTSGSKKKNLHKEWLHTRRIGGCVAFEGLFICGLSVFCMERSNPLPLYILLPISLVVCAIILYFIFKNNPMKK